MFEIARARFRGLWNRRYFLWSQVRPPEIPPHNLSWLPARFHIQPLRGTGFCITDDFCSDDEATKIRTGDMSPLASLVQRAAMLGGISADCLDQLVVNDAQQGTDQCAYELFPHVETASDCFSVWVCLATGDGDGEVGLSVRSARHVVDALVKPGRAISGNVANLSSVPANSQCSVQMWFGNKERQSSVHKLMPSEIKQSAMGISLSGNESLPDGVWAPGQDHLETVFGKPDQLTELVK